MTDPDPADRHEVMGNAAWRPLDPPSPHPATTRRPSRCPDDEVVDLDATP